MVERAPMQPARVEALQAEVAPGKVQQVRKKKKKVVKQVSADPAQEVTRAVEKKKKKDKKRSALEPVTVVEKKNNKKKKARVVEPEPTGSLWKNYKNITVGRVVIRRKDGRRGVVMFPPACLCEHKLASTDYMVRWDGMEELDGTQLVQQKDVARWMTHTFGDASWVHVGLLDLQENGWEPLPEGWERKRANVGWLGPPASKPKRVRKKKPAEDGAAAADGEKKKAAPRARKKKAAPVDVPAEVEEEKAEVPLGDDPIKCPATNRLLPAALCLVPGDQRVGQHDEDKDGDYIVERIMDQRVGLRGKLEYLIKWKGFELNLGTSENEKGDWERHSNVKGCEALIKWEKAKPAWWLAQENVEPPHPQVRPRKKAKTGAPAV